MMSSIDEQIEHKVRVELIASGVGASLAELHAKLDLLLDAIAVQQKDAAAIAETTEGTIIKKAKAGKVARLSADGSRKKFLTLKSVHGLKKR